MTAYLALVGAVGDGVTNLANSFGASPQVLDSAVSLQLENLQEQNFHSASGYLSLENLLAGLALKETSTSAEEVGEIKEETLVSEAPSNNLAEAIVNIYCTQIVDGYKKSISGTGFLVSENGVILTNAHMAQFLLLEKANIFGEVECSIRTGADIGASYDVDLLYISPSWIIANADLITSSAPKGTGESDFALLYITDYPASGLPYLNIDTDYLPTNIKGQTVILVGYPQLTGRDDTDTSSARKMATTTVPEIYTFGGERYVDIFTLAGSILGAQGASGGPVLNEEGKVIGVISTRGDDEKYGKGSLRAITTSYIDRSIESETGYSLRSTMSGDLVRRAQIFKDTLTPILSGLLADQI